ncbi:Crp/Fnr family transcriptional regulator [Paractinoplanes rishiriensis]|uniref:Cyclic nucleotide-binding domain-containing protein n=1 Tax=Paractinoplanes rishiriensis TaxID=1050105 RepID=A0A919KDA0_9ACTN|nr:cyclic nucleotide-binding domain-containing protein [Actinoplanes rishiriensis]GIF02072.1 hypothetical protein Ari01nite_95360 [Actinoplanes rishiriensis]
MTSSLTVFDHLVLHPFAADLPGAWLRGLAACARPATWPVDTRLAREGSPADQFWLLESGTVELDFHVPGHGDVPFQRLGAGRLLGWSWLVPPYRWVCGARVLQQCGAIELRATAVRELAAADPEFGVALTTRVLTGAVHQLQTARQRVAERHGR